MFVMSWVIYHFFYLFDLHSRTILERGAKLITTHTPLVKFIKCLCACQKLEPTDLRLRLSARVAAFECLK